MEAAPEREREREGRGDEWSDGGVPLGFRVKACSRESAGQKAASVLEADLRSHWSTATNTKEWILLELNEPCLVSHIRVYNKSVLEWEVTAGLRFKPEAFVKVRPRGEAPKRDMVYPANHTPCRYVRISCLRGSPIAIYFIQLTGIPVPGLEPEFQPLVNYLSPLISSSQKQSHTSHNMHLQAKAACVLLDLCRGPLSPWVPMITIKVDLAVELLEDLLDVIQGVGQSLARSRAALKYVVLALSGNMDDVLTEYREFKHKLLFILEMVDPYIDHAMSVMKDTLSFGGVSAAYLDKQEKSCDIALNIIRTAAKSPAVLPSLELEWRRGDVTPSVLLSILDPHMPLPPDVDLCKSSMSEVDQAALTVSNSPATHSCNPEDVDGRDASDTVRVECFEQCNSLFAPEELKQSELRNTLRQGHNKVTTILDQNIPEGRKSNIKLPPCLLQLDNTVASDYNDVQADYLQLLNHQECELRALEFRRLAQNLCMQQEPTIVGHNAGIDALILAAECYVNPFFLLDLRLNSEPLDRIELAHSELIQGNASFDLKGLRVKDLDIVAANSLENKRDRAVLDLLLQAARFDSEYQKKIPDGEIYPNDAEDDNHAIEISPEATYLVDAVTLVRKNQALLCHFIMKQFQRKGHSSNEILLDSLLFLLHSATDLFCPPDNVIDIILKSAENLNRQLTCLYSSVNAGDKKLDKVKLHGLQRRWALLQKLVLASSGSDNTRELVSIRKDGFRFRSLVPPSAWMHKISEFSKLSSPLARFLGWMAVSRYAKEYLNEKLFLASDFSQLTSLLSIFTDELCLMDGVATQKVKSANIEQSDCNKYLLLKQETSFSDQPSANKLFQILLPELHFFFPSMSRLFHAFGESILEAVGLQLKCLPKSAVQYILCWFSEMCLWPYLESIKEHLILANEVSCLRGNIAANVKAVVFYLLESVVAEHLEAIVPEMPRVVHILVSLCRASYTDVAFLESVLCLMKPLIYYFLRKGTGDEKVMGQITDCSDFELICFEELFEIIRCCKHSEDAAGDKIQVPLLIFILGSLIPDLSFKRRIEILGSLLVLVDCISSDPPSLLCSYLQGFHTLIDGCVTILVQNIELLGISILSVRNKSGGSAHSLSGDAMMQLEKNVQDSAEQVLVTSADDAENSKGVDAPPAGCIIDFCDALEKLISHIIPSIEGSWKCHHQLACRLSLSLAKCLLYVKCLRSVTQGNAISSSTRQEVEIAQKHWESALEGLAEIILENQEKQCWQVASTMLDYMIKLPNVLAWGTVLSATCSAIEHLCSHAPRISWRLQTEKWLSLLVSDGIEDLKNSETSLINLFCTMLSHAEPEQRSIALQQLGRIINLASTAEVTLQYPSFDQHMLASGSTVTSHLVTHTWNRITALALYDSSMILRKHAMALLTEYVPFVDRDHLRSFLASSNSILNGVGQLSYVLSSLSSVESYFEFFSISSDQEYQELEEAEIELELIEKEKSVPKFVGYPQDIVVPDVASYYKDGSEVNKRLQQIRADIQSLERSRLREEIIARRQKKLLIRRTREKYLEETSSREMELMQALDRERTIEMERDIERQRQLDLERAKSRELQYNLEMEREKQTQRELQRELEQVELGRSSRREFSANPNSRTRERYRERDNVRSPQHDGSRSQGHEGQPTVVVGASRPSFPTILQSRDRGSDGYEDNAEGSRDSGGDTSSMGDPEFDGPGSGMRHGTRSGSSRSSRPVVERRERDGRREGKWERKQ
ncbi:hypothetical protein ACQ4PT_064731 [Festuca glaucescens]